jgi:hypothetical protein
LTRRKAKSEMTIAFSFTPKSPKGDFVVRNSFVQGVIPNGALRKVKCPIKKNNKQVKNDYFERD